MDAAKILGPESISDAASGGANRNGAKVGIEFLHIVGCGRPARCYQETIRATCLRFVSFILGRGDVDAVSFGDAAPAFELAGGAKGELGGMLSRRAKSS